MLLLNEAPCTVRAASRLIKASEQRTLTAAETLLHAARQAAQAHRDAAAEEFARAQREGYATGQTLAAEAYGHLAAAWAQKSKRFETEALEKITAIVLETLHTYFDEVGDSVLVQALVRRACAALGRGPFHFSVTVSADMNQPELTDKLRLDSTGSEYTLDTLRMDKTLPPQTCIVSSPIGSVTLSLESQCAALAAAFATALKRSETP